MIGWHSFFAVFDISGRITDILFCYYFMLEVKMSQEISFEEYILVLTQ